jgi:hypothetical protein
MHWRTVIKWFEFIYDAKREELGYLVDVLVKGPISSEKERTYKLELRLLDEAYVMLSEEYYTNGYMTGRTSKADG